MFCHACHTQKEILAFQTNLSRRCNECIKKALKPVVMPRISKPAQCHPTKPVWAKGKCPSCYYKDWRINKILRESRSHNAPTQTSSLSRHQAALR